MSVDGIGAVSPVSAISALRAAEPEARATASDGDPAAFFDATSWRGPQPPTVSVGPARVTGGDLAALSRDVLAAILR
jgi:hypothetical protein